MSDAARIYVMPGELHWSETPTIFKTVLGSCVSVCLWDAQRRVGGLNHYILPRCRAGSDDPRFGDIAIPRLLDALETLGCTALVAKVFGGAAVLAGGRAPAIGDANTELAVAMLQRFRIPIVAQRTGGVQGVVIRFSSSTGDVQLREIATAPSGWAVPDSGRAPPMAPQPPSRVLLEASPVG